MRQSFLIFRIITLLLVVALVPGRAAAEGPAPETNLSIFQSKTLEYALLEYGMLAVRREQGLMNESLRSQFVFTLERLVEVYCMPELSNSLEYVGPATGDGCLKHLEELESYHSDNPVALCARHGIDSDSCVDSYQGQYIRRYTPPTKQERIDDSQDYLVKLNAPSEAEIAKYKNYATFMNKFKRDPSTENRLNVEKSLSVQLRKDCNPTRYRLTLSEPGAKYKANFQKDKGDDDPLQELVDLYSNPDQHRKKGRVLSIPSLDKNRKTGKHKNNAVVNKDYAGLSVVEKEEEKVTFPTAWRLRLLPPGCEAALNRAFNYDLQFPQAVCYREGFMSPACIRALRAQRQRMLKLSKEKKIAAGSAEPAEPAEPSGFSSF